MVEQGDQRRYFSVDGYIGSVFQELGWFLTYLTSAFQFSVPLLCTLCATTGDRPKPSTFWFLSTSVWHD